MGINKGKHIVQEIEGIRCTVVETGISETRMKFLKEILETNNYIVNVSKEKKTDENAPDTFITGVTDILFNPVIAIYERTLKTQDGNHVTPEYWNQETTFINPYYWRLKR
ncbi:MAG: hypothetical protein HY958_10555 [Bacteroidia bacterium]|nr:hypothetical protein [Bacteroidia bacterium]